MKKINSFRAVFMIAIFTFIQFAGSAQNVSVSAYGGLSIDQAGLVSERDITGGVTGLLGLGPAETSIFSLGLDMGGGQRYRYQVNLRTKDNKSDSLIFRTTNAPSIMLWAVLGVPLGGVADEAGGTNKFAGSGLIVGYGFAFPDRSQTPANVLKIGLQGNYCIKEGKNRISIFLRPSFNALYSGSSFDEAWDVSVGANFSMFGGSSDSDY